MEGLDLPPHRIPGELFQSLSTGADRQIGNQLPGDGGSPGWGVSLVRVDHRESQRRILFLLSNGREDFQPLVFDFKGSPRHASLAITNLDLMNGLYLSVLHRRRNRLLAIDGETVHAGADEKSCVLGLGLAEELVDVALPVHNMYASAGFPQQLRGQLQVVQPANALFLFEGDPRGVDRSLQRVGSLEAIPRPKLDRTKA